MYMIISIDKEKACDKIQHSFIIFSETQERVELPKLDKEHPLKKKKNPTANI